MNGTSTSLSHSFSASPRWSVDGERLVFIKSNQGSDAIYWRRADGAGDPEHLVDARAAEG